MTTFTEKLCFSDKKENDKAIEIEKFENTNFLGRLSLYCLENNIDLESIEDEEIFAALDLMAEHGQADKETKSYFFYID